MKTNLLRIVLAVLLLLGTVIPVYAQGGYGAPVDSSPCDTPPGEWIIVDILFLRPAGIAAMGVGLVGAVIALPFAALSGSTDRICQRLIREPFEYTFKRPVGNLNYESCNPEDLVK
jgi:hypothetical protein